jgi:hypothetical protein
MVSRFAITINSVLVRNARTGLIIPQLVEMPRMRPAIKAGLLVLLEAADPYMRPVLEGLDHREGCRLSSSVNPQRAEVGILCLSRGKQRFSIAERS